MTTGDGEPRTFGDRYVLGERITAGDAREVWRAHDDVVSRQVALKIFFGAQAADPAWREAFRHAAERLAALSHPGIAKVYAQGEHSNETWLAMAFSDGEPLATRIAGAHPLTAAQALDIVGHTALAIQAIHDAGTTHGGLTADNLLIRPDGVVAVIGFAVASGATEADDLRALGELARDCLDAARTSTADLPAEVADFVGWLTDTGRSRPPKDAADIGRTALALADSLSGKHVTSVVPSAHAGSAMEDTPGSEPRYDAAQRKLIRNRLIALGTITVVAGAALLWVIDRGGGPVEVTVPSVVGLQLSQAQTALTTDVLRVDENVTDPAGIVLAQSPRAGTRVKAGTIVTLSIGRSSGG